MVPLIIGATIYLYSHRFGLNKAVMVTALAYFFIITEELIHKKLENLYIHVSFFPTS
jgi:hypothetical protein